MPIYQISILLAPKGILVKIEGLLRRFLWKGGKNNEKRLHLVGWGKVTKPIMEGGLQLRDMHSYNLALGSKILWNLVSGSLNWSKKALWKKYFMGDRRRCLDSHPRVLQGSPVFSLCLKAAAFFTPELTWIPGNGENI